MGKSLHWLPEQNAPKHLKEKWPEPIRNHQSAKRDQELHITERKGRKGRGKRTGTELG